MGYLGTALILTIPFRSQLGRALSNKGGYLIYKDEAQNSLHPEWCRTFINDFISSFKTISEFCLKTKEIKHAKKTVVFATHSPFFLSDVTNDNVIYLLKKNDEVISEHYENNILQEILVNYFIPIFL